MESRASQKGIIAAIVFASAVISGSLVFSSLAFTGQLSANVISKPATTEVSQSDLDKKIADSIDSYARTKAATTTQPTQPASASSAAQNLRKPDPATDHIRGDNNARISLVEYSDFECGFCRMFHPTVQKLMDSYQGKVNWVYRHYPLPSHDPAATLLAVASECAAEQGGNDAFWKFGDALFSPSTQHTANDDAEWAASLAAQIGLDKAKMASCIKDDKPLAKVQASYAEGTSFGVNGTPGNFLLDNKTGKVQFVPGALSYDRLKTLVDNMLAE